MYELKVILVSRLVPLSYIQPNVTINPLLHYKHPNGAKNSDGAKGGDA